MMNRKLLLAAGLIAATTLCAVVPAFAAERNEAEAPAEVTEQQEARPERGSGHARHGRHGLRGRVEAPENAIGRDAAKEAALADAGLDAGEVERVRARLSEKDGTVVYKVHFTCDGQRYSYRIDPLTGAVLDKTVGEATEHDGHGGRCGHGGHGDRARPAETDTLQADASV